ncbi:enolase-phosphatase E1 [Coemansia sp. S610]|nr:enolase-phosphatase E1 [Coemansia sp. S610]KAJ2362449.1 enolase-phosphatase E1 [Coemansia sp. RSA 2611]KAJ2414280.1 enolase-phosphatase E1 [Coemansia sp. RSA 2530]KAJ2703558.1 enolase-phosphatase E1 [Coemansia sp. IMI 209128]
MTSSSYDIVLLDIEGTTTPISFVHEALFPYVARSVGEFLETRWTDPEVQTHVQAIAQQANEDVKNGIAAAIAIDLDADSSDEIRRKVLANVDWQMKADRKIGALKGLQGYMWRFGFESGILKGEMYPDAVKAIERWVEAGKRVFIYSSGSVEAQKLIFGYSDHGDLLQFISGHYDTKVGGKTEDKSYRSIVEDIGVLPARVLFVSDNVFEIQAADTAGLQTMVSVRPGNAPIKDDCKFQTTTDFMSIPL